MRSLADRFYPRVRVLLVVDYVRSIFVTDKANGSAKKKATSSRGGCFCHKSERARMRGDIQKAIVAAGNYSVASGGCV